MSLVYFAFFVFVGGFVSSRTESSTSSIIINLFIWCFLLFLLPNAASYIGKNITKTEDYKQLAFNTQQVDAEFWSQQYPEIHKTLQDEGLELTGWNYCSGGDWDGCPLVLFTPRSCMEYEHRRKELVNPILLANCDKKWAIQQNYLQRVYRQEKTVRYLSCLSPAEIFKQISASLCRTGMESEVNFMEQVRLFQDMYYGYFMQNGIFSSYAYFTMQKEQDFPETWEEADMQATTWRETARPESTFDFSSFGYIDTSMFPRFVYAQPTLGNDLQSQLYLLAGILIVCILLFWFSFVSFIKYDLR